MGVDHVADWQVGDLANLRQQLLRRLNADKAVHHGDAVAGHNESGIAASLAAVRTDGGVDSVADFLDGEVWLIGAESRQRKDTKQDKEENQVQFHRAKW